MHIDDQTLVRMAERLRGEREGARLPRTCGEGGRARGLPRTSLVLTLPHSPFPIPHSPFPIPHSPFPHSLVRTSLVLTLPADVSICPISRRWSATCGECGKRCWVGYIYIAYIYTE